MGAQFQVYRPQGLNVKCSVFSLIFLPIPQTSHTTFSFLKYILLIMLLQLSHLPPFIPLCPVHPLPPTVPLFSSCPWVVHRSSLASTFPILFLTSSCLFSTYHLCYLFSVPFPPLSPSHYPADNPPCDLNFCDSVPVLVVCLVCFCLVLFKDSVVNSYEFVVIILFIVLIFFLDKSL